MSLSAPAMQQAGRQAGTTAGLEEIDIVEVRLPVSLWPGTTV